MKGRTWLWASLALGVLLGAPGAQAAGPPLIGPSWTATVSTTAAGLRSEINPNGLSTTYHFLLITQAAYDANVANGQQGFLGARKIPAGTDPSVGSGTVPVTVSQSAGSLTIDTAYRYRAVAANSGGTTPGPDLPFRTEAFATGQSLPDSRAWELVSPVDKGGDEVQGFGQSFGGGMIRAAAGGSALTYSSTSSFGGSDGAAGASQYIARRGSGGWATENVSLATEAGAYGLDPDGVPYRLFSGSLSRALLLDGRVCAPGDPCPVGFSLRDNSTGALVAATPEDPDLRLAGASPDLGTAILSSCEALTGNAVSGCLAGEDNLYRWSPTAGLATLNLLPATAVSAPGAELAAPLGAVSSTGDRVYWTHLPTGNLYLRDGAETKQVDAAAGGGGTFEAASSDGAVAFYTKAGHLWRYDAVAGTSADLTPGGEVLGVLGAAEDGSRVYFLATTGLYLHQGGTSSKIADGAAASNYPPATGTARVTPSGSHLAFLSASSLTGFDNRHASSGAPQSEVFLYDAVAGSLLCASCSSTGERPIGPSTIPGAIANGSTLTHKPRNLSDDGRRLYFDSQDALAVEDTGGKPDVYQWERVGTGSCTRAEGCHGLISRGRSDPATFLDASSQGTDVFFLTNDSLVSSDFGFADIYDAREGGGFPEPSKPIDCVGDACQPLPSAPEDPSPGTLVQGSGNPPLAIAQEPTACKKGFVKKRGKCVKKKKGKKKARKGKGR